MAGTVQAEPPTAGSAGASFLRPEDERVAAAVYRLAFAGRAFCPVPFPLTGIAFHHLGEYQPDDRPALARRFGLARGPGILGVVPESPAAAAGLRAGDVLLRINELPVRAGPAPGSAPASAKWRAGMEAAEDQLEQALRVGPAQLLLLRGGTALVEARLTAVPGCPARVRLARSGQHNAFATRRHVILTSATLAFVASDDELAVVLGHELAHVILGHPERLERERVPKGLLRGVGRNADRIRATEEEADRLGLKLAWAAGYDPAAAIPFWRRYYARFDGPQLFRTHPSLPARERLIRQILAELEPGPQRPELGKGALPEG
jgi:hypothetical protein